MLVVFRVGHVRDAWHSVRVVLRLVGDACDHFVPVLVKRACVFSVRMWVNHAARRDLQLSPAHVDARPNGEVSEVEGAADGHCLPAVVSREWDGDAVAVPGFTQEFLVQLNDAVQVSGLLLQVHGATASRGIRRKSPSRGPSA